MDRRSSPIAKYHRSVHSKTWAKTNACSDLTFVDLQFLPHTSNFIIFFEEMCFLLGQLSVLATDVRCRIGIKTVGHEYFFRFLRHQFIIENLNPALQQTILVGLFALLLARVYLTASIVSRNRGHKQMSQGAKRDSALLGWLGFFSTTFLLLPTIEVSVLAFRAMPGYLCVASVLLLLSPPADVLVQVLLTFDYKFQRSNIIQGRNYTYYTFRTLGFWLIGLVNFSIKGRGQLWLEILLDCCHIFMATALIAYRTKMNNFHNFSMMNKLMMFSNSFYFWESFSLTIEHIMPQYIAHLDLDCLAVTLLPVVLVLIVALYEREWRSEIISKINLMKDSVIRRVLFIDLLTHCYAHKETPDYRFFLVSAISNHMHYCHNCHCLCSLLRSTFETKIGPKSGAIVRSIFKILKDQEEIEKDKIVLFSNAEILAEIRAHNDKQITALPLPHADQIELRREAVDSGEAKVSYCMNLEEKDSFMLFICSLFNSVISSHVGSGYFGLFLLFARFLIFEYTNPLASLVTIYAYLYSYRYKADSTFLRDVLVQNLLRASTARFASLQDDKYDMHLPKLDLARVMRYRARVDLLAESIQRMIALKVRLYTAMREDVMDFSQVRSVASQLQSQIKAAEAEIAALSRAFESNGQLVSESIRFELMVKEKLSASSKLKKLHREMVASKFNRSSLLDTLRKNKRLASYDSANCFVSCRFDSETLRIVNYTRNTCELVDADPEDSLLEAKLKEFMPPRMRKHHDALVVNYLNGVNKNRTKGVAGNIHGIFLSRKGHAKSASIYPKVEVVFLEEVLVAALVVPVDLPGQLVLYTDETGGLIAQSQAAAGIVGGDCKFERPSVFPLMPRLLRALAPHSWSRQADKEPGEEASALLQQLAPGNQVTQLIAGLPQGSSHLYSQSTLDDDVFIFPPNDQLIMKIDRSATPDHFSLTDCVSQAKVLQFQAGCEVKGSALLSCVEQYFEKYKEHLFDGLFWLQQARVTVTKYCYSNDFRFNEVRLDAVSQSSPKAVQLLGYLLSHYKQDRELTLLEVLCLKPDHLESLQKIGDSFKEFLEILESNKTGASLIADLKRDEQNGGLLEMLRQDLEFRMSEAKRHVKSNGLKRAQCHRDSGHLPQYSDTLIIYPFETSEEDREGKQSDRMQRNLTKRGSRKLTVFTATQRSTTNSVIESEEVKKEVKKVLTNLEKLKGVILDCIQELAVYFASPVLSALVIQAASWSEADNFALNYSANRNLKQRHLLHQSTLKSAGQSFQKSRQATGSIAKDNGNESANKEQREVSSDPLDINLAKIAERHTERSDMNSVQSLNEGHIIRKSIATSAKTTVFWRLLVFKNLFISVLLVLLFLINNKYFQASEAIFEVGQRAEDSSHLMGLFGYFYKEMVACKNRDSHPQSAALATNSDEFGAYLGEYANSLKKIGSLLVASALDLESCPNSEHLVFNFYSSVNNLLLKFTALMADQSLLHTTQCQPLQSTLLEVNDYALSALTEDMQAVSKEQDYLGSLFLVYCGIVLVISLYFFLYFLLAISKVHSQLKKETQLLMMVEKKRVVAALLKYSSFEKVPAKAGWSEHNGTFKQSTLLQKSRPRDHFTTRPEESVGGTTMSKKRTRAIRPKKHTDVPVSIGSRFIHMPHLRVAKNLSVLFVALLLINVPSVVHIVLHKTLNLHMRDGMDTFALAAQSSAALGFYAGMIHDAGAQAGPGSTASRFVQRARETLHRVATSEISLIKDKLKNTQYCSYVASIFGAAERAACEEAVENASHASISSALYEFIYLTDELQKSLQQDRGFDWAEYFASKTYRKTASQAEYLPKVLCKLATEALAETADLESKFSASLVTLTAIFAAFVAFYLTVYSFAWLKKNMVVLSEVRAIFVVLNDDMLNNMYFKAYFKQR